MGALWVVLVSALCVLGRAHGAPVEPCDSEPVFEVEPRPPPATPCVGQLIEAVPVGIVLPPVYDDCEEVVTSAIPPMVGPPVLAPYPPQIVLPPYPPPAMIAPYPASPVVSLYGPPPPTLPCTLSAANRLSPLPPSNPPCPLSAANPPSPTPEANPPCPPPAANPPCPPPAANPPCTTPVAYPPCSPPAVNHPCPTPVAYPPCPPPAANPPCDANPPGDAETPLPLPPTPLSFALPVPPQPLGANVFSLLSQAQNGDTNAILSQLTQYLASTLPTSQLQAAAAAIPAPEPCDASVEPPPCPCPAPIPSPLSQAPPHPSSPITPYPTIQTPISYFPPAPTPPGYFPPQRFEPESSCNQPLDLSTLIALQKQASRGLISLSPDIQAQINQVEPPGCSPSLPTVESSPASLEMSKFGQASSQLLRPWPRVYDPLRRLYKPCF